MSSKWVSKKSGFTIVELLIVIVVIGILAAIVLVAYNGTQERARYAVMQSDLESLNKGILLYHAANGSYPVTTLSCITATPNQTLDIPGLVPDYMSKIPRMPSGGIGGVYAYCRSTNGVDYKIVRLVPSGQTLPAIEQTNPNLDPQRPGRGWGHWSAGGTNL